MILEPVPVEDNYKNGSQEPGAGGKRYRLPNTGAKFSDLQTYIKGANIPFFLNRFVGEFNFFWFLELIELSDKN